LNTLGYSPVRLDEYLAIVGTVIGSSDGLVRRTQQKKPIILSVTGPPEDVQEAYVMIERKASEEGLELGMEINLSCPNIHGKPPPAYNGAALAEYLALLQAQKCLWFDAVAGSRAGRRGLTPPPVGIKLPPYTYMGQFEEVVGALARATVAGRSVVDFVTATNTLGSSLVLDEGGHAALASEAGTGIGGLAGVALHPLALGNVATLRRLLDQMEETKDVTIIGVGGVCDWGGFERMRKAGAGAVAVATALGREGVGVFEKILTGKGVGSAGGQRASGADEWAVVCDMRSEGIKNAGDEEQARHAISCLMADDQCRIV
jgi:dihydroorotate dehydrogenase (fumarate)